MTLALAALVMTGADTGGGAVTVRARDAVPVPAALVAPRPTGKLPACAGTPEINPVAGSSDNPSGNPVALKPVGLLVPVIW